MTTLNSLKPSRALTFHVYVLCSQELARQLNNEVLPKFQEAGVKVFLISIGPPERGIKFNDLTGLPQANILADPENITYAALRYKTDTYSAFFSWDTPKAIWKRIQEDGAEDLKIILKRWPKEGFFIPPKNEQVNRFLANWSNPTES